MSIAVLAELPEFLNTGDPVGRWNYGMLVVRLMVGGALLQPGLEKADRERVPCYLETAKEINVRFYEKHGFQVVKKVDLPRGGPPVWTMLREPIG